MSPKSKKKIESYIANRYRINKMIGEGGFCVVLKAFDEVTGEVVAIKRSDKSKEVYKKMKSHNCNQTIKHLMMKEANIMKALEHRNIMKLLNVIVEEEVIYLVVELAEGGELFNKILKRTRFPENEAKEIIKQVIAGIKFMHLKGFVHRDIKAENILFAKKGPMPRIIIADFGLSRRMDDVMVTNCGTVNYSAPELLLNKSSKEGYNYKIDNWSIGVLTYFVLAGCLPFNLPNQNENEIKRQILHGRFSFTKVPWPKISQAAKDFITDLLVRNPLSRIELEDAESHFWISQINRPKLQTIELYPRMEKTLNVNLVLIRWTVLLYFNLSIIYLWNKCLNLKSMSNLKNLKENGKL